ncbi:hypothetical protein J9303_07885 [Bacillaceae bacterium Marseille-Q3522]|nr:hypothetical protein [Bacillaceae bacterium Marseille-Q3522]
MHGKKEQLLCNIPKRYVLKTRKHQVQELYHFLGVEQAKLELRVSGSVYNFFTISESGINLLYLLVLGTVLFFVLKRVKISWEAKKNFFNNGIEVLKIGKY